MNILEKAEKLAADLGTTVVNIEEAFAAWVEAEWAAFEGESRKKGSLAVRDPETGSVTDAPADQPASEAPSEDKKDETLPTADPETNSDVPSETAQPAAETPPDAEPAADAEKAAS